MKAAAINSYGSADVIEFLEVPKPTIKPNQLLLKVHYASINPVDWKMRNGRFKLILGNKFPKVLGLECAGEVVEIGKNITKFKVGDRIIGSSFPGCYAEFTAVNEDKAVKIPDSLSYADASTIPIACMTAYFSLFDLGNLNKGDKVLINGASGGVGLFSVQIAHIIGADITAVCSEKNFNLVKSFDDNIRLVDYNKTDVTKENIPYKVVFDIVNSLKFNQCKKILTPNGTYIATDMKNDLIPAIAFSLLAKQKAKIILNNPKPKDIEKVLPYFTQNRLKVIIDKEFALSETKEAHLYSESKRATGKIVIKVI